MTCRCQDPRVHGHHADCPAGLGPPPSWRNTIPGVCLSPVRQPAQPARPASRPPFFRRFPTLERIRQLAVDAGAEYAGPPHPCRCHEGACRLTIRDRIPFATLLDDPAPSVPAIPTEGTS